MDAENLEKGIRLLKSSLPPLHKSPLPLQLNEDLFVEPKVDLKVDLKLEKLDPKFDSKLDTKFLEPKLETLTMPAKSPVLDSVKVDVKVPDSSSLKSLEKPSVPSVPDKKELNFLLTKNKLTKNLKSSELYKYFLYFLAFVVMLYLTRNYWWKYVTKKFFPSEEVKDLKTLEKDLGSEVDFFDVNNIQEVLELEDKDAVNVKKPAPYAKVLLIYANWCGHCKDMMKAFEEAARHTHDKSKTSANKVVFMRAESSRAPKLANAPNIQGFPTIVGIFQNGKEFPYNGPRNMESFIKFADLIAIGGLNTQSESASGTGLDIPKPRVLPKRVVKTDVPIETPTEKDSSLDTELLKPSFQETLDEDDASPSLNEHVTEDEVQDLVKKTLENIDKLKLKEETTYSYFGGDTVTAESETVQPESVQPESVQPESESISEPLPKRERKKTEKVLDEEVPSSKKVKVKKDIKL